MSTIRPAHTTDVFAMVALLRDQYARSRYVGRVNIDDKYARSLLAQMIQRHGGTHAGATLVNVVETGEGVICGFCAGLLDRVHMIGDRLVAQDIFLVIDEASGSRGSMRLLSQYFQWAEAIPAVLEITLSHTDAIPDGERVGQFYERLGFVRCGALYRRDTAKRGEALAA